MPAPVLKFLTVFEALDGYGWTEVHYKQSASENPNLQVALDNFELNVAASRQTLLGQNGQIVGIRVSYPRGNAIASLGRREALVGTENQPSSNAATSLAINFVDASFTKSKVVHLRSFWDSVEQDGEYTPGLGVGWQDRLVAWKGALVSGGYGWLSKSPTTSTSGDVISYDVGITGKVSFILKAPGINAAYIGTRQQVRFSKFHFSKSPLNRSILVNVIDATHLTTVQPIGCDPATSEGHYNHRATAFTGYNNTGSISVGERRMGRPLNRYPGRRPAQARY